MYSYVIFENQYNGVVGFMRSYEEAEKLAEKHGFYFECYDAGTYIATEL